MSMERKDISEEIVNNISRIICEFAEEIKLNSVAFGPLCDLNRLDRSSLTDEERKKKAAECCGITIRTKTHLTEEQKQEVLNRINKKIFKFEVGEPPLF